MHGWVGIRENINTIQIRKKKMNKQESNFNKKKIIIGLIGSNWTGHHNKKEKACNSWDPPLLVGEDFYTLVNVDLFSSSTHVGHHNPPLLGPSVFAGTRSFLRSMWDRSQIHLPLGPNVLIDTPSRVYPPSRNSEKVDTSSGVWLWYHL